MGWGGVSGVGWRKFRPSQAKGPLEPSQAKLGAQENFGVRENLDQANPNNGAPLEPSQAKPRPPLFKPAKRSQAKFGAKALEKKIEHVAPKAKFGAEGTKEKK